MRKILIGILLIMMIFGMADAVRYPAGFFSGNVDMMGYTLTNATSLGIGMGSYIDTGYGLKNSTANKAQVNLSADMGLAFDTGARLGALKVVNGHGIDLGASGVEVDPDDIRDPLSGLVETTSNHLGVNLTAAGGLEFGTGANSGALMAKVADGLELKSDGINVKLADTSLAAAGSGVSLASGAIKMDIIGGGTPGNFTLTGAANGDELVGVTWFAGNGTVLLNASDISSEFSIPDTNILNQTYSGGTTTTNGYLQVFWIDRTD